MAKKQKSKSISIKESAAFVGAGKVKSVNPPEEATRNLMTGGYDIDRVKAAQIWFKTARETQQAFLGVSDEKYDPKNCAGKGMLHKEKKKKK